MARSLLLVLIGFSAGAVLGYLLASGPPPVAVPFVPTMDNEEIRQPRSGQQDVSSPGEAGPAITGRIRTAAGSPLDGVRLIPVTADDRPLTRECESGLNGGFTTGGLPPGAYRLSARLNGWEFETVPPGNVWYRPGDNAELLARPVREVEVRVVLPDGGTASRAEILCRQGSVKKTLIWSQSDSTVRLGPGDWRLSATAAEGVLRSPETRVDQAHVALDLHLAGSPSIHGRVLFPDDEQGYPVYVCILRIASEQQADASLLAGSRKGKLVESAHEAEFNFPDLQPGLWLLGAFGPDGTVHGLESVVVDDDPVSREIPVPPAPYPKYLLLKVESPAGEALTDVELAVGVRHGSRARYWRSPSSIEILPDGRIRIPHYVCGPNEHREDMHYRIAVTSSDYGKVGREYDPARESELLVRYTDPAKLEVRVSGIEGSALNGRVRVELEPAPGAARGFTDYRDIGADGCTEYGPLAPGEYTITVGVDRGRRNLQPLAERTVTLASGTVVERFALPRVCTVTVRGAPGSYDLRPASGIDRRPIGGIRPSENGQVEFDFVPAGHYLLTAYRDIGRRRIVSIGHMALAVNEDLEVGFLAAPVNAFLVRITDPAGALAQAGLADGDRIVAINGKEPEDLQDLRSSLRSARTQETVRLTVLRSGQRHQVTLDAKLLAASEAAGGALIETAR